MVKSKSLNRSTALLDIRLKNLEHDIIVLKGNEHTAASTYIEGKIMLSISEQITLKKISLKLYSTLRLRYGDLNKSQQGVRPTRLEKKLYEHNWDSSEFAKFLKEAKKEAIDNSSIAQGGQERGSHVFKPNNNLHISKSNSIMSSTTSLKNLGLSLRSLSSTSLASSSNNSSSTSLNNKGSQILISGNYEIPFSAILPGDMPESVEGLPGASVSYKLEALLDRGKFHNLAIAMKHVRVIRTMTADSVELSETMAVDNTWPKKVEYSLSVPSKAIAIGSGTLVSIMLVPLLKGLRLGSIKMTLIEMYSYVGYLPPPYLAERAVCERNIPKPSDDDPRCQMDKWEFTYFLRVPFSLSKCTQDLEVQPHMKVRHKLKFVIGLINPDGHISELRASLPVQLFISPFVTITGSVEDEEGEVSSLDNKGEPHSEEILFHSDSNSTSTLNPNEEDIEGDNLNRIRSNRHSISSFNGVVAPPMYEQHVYDRLWSEISSAEPPITSGDATPRSLFSRPNGEVLQFSMSAIDTAKLAENLRQLSVQRQLQEHNESGRSTPSRPVFELDGDAIRNGDYFSRSRTSISPSLSSFQMNALLSPRNVSPIHLSRSGSDYHVDTITNKIPSYSEALRGGVEESLSPIYLPPLPGSQIDLTEVNRRFVESVSRSPIGSPASNVRNRLFLARDTSSFSLKSSSNNSSNNPSPITSRNASFNNLLSFGSDRNRTPINRLAGGSGLATFSIPPL